LPDRRFSLRENTTTYLRGAKGDFVLPAVAYSVGPCPFKNNLADLNQFFDSAYSSYSLQGVFMKYFNVLDTLLIHTLA
jgi:hypothetical protein